MAKKKGNSGHRVNLELLRAIRLALPMGDADFAKATVVAPSHVSNLLSGGTVGMKTFRKLHDAVLKHGWAKYCDYSLGWVSWVHPDDRAEVRATDGQVPLPPGEPEDDEDEQGEVGVELPANAGHSELAVKDTPGSVSLKEFGLFLREYAKRMELTERTVAQQFVDLERDWEGRSQWPAEAGERQLGPVRGLLGRLYKGEVEREVPLDDLLRMMRAHTSDGDPDEILKLMAGWLCVKPHDQSHVVVCWGQGGRLEKGLGKGVQYENASRRLSGMDCSFVKFVMDPYTGVTEQGAAALPDDVPHSRPHIHPGDEFIFVLEGTVLVELDNTGIRNPLSAGGYIHFNAEIPHSVWNPGAGQAVAVIVRFFQLAREGTRETQLKKLTELEAMMTKLSGEYSRSPGQSQESCQAKPEKGLLDRIVAGNEQLVADLQQLKTECVKLVSDVKQFYAEWAEIAPWLHDRTRRPERRLCLNRNALKVRDLVGLSQFLLAYVADMPQNAAAEIPELDGLRDVILRLRGLSPEGAPAADTPEANLNRFEDYVAFRSRLLRFAKQHRRGEDHCDVFSIYSCFEGLPINNAKPTSDTLKLIAGVLRMPQVLLDGYLASNALRVVVVRGAYSGKEVDRLSTPSDWVGQPSETTKAAAGVHYHIPARSLANSDMTIVLLDLDKGKVTDWNRHPGFEVVMPVSGEVAVQFHEKDVLPTPVLQKTDESKWCSEKSGMIIYRSRIPHRVINPSADKKARALVLRFNIHDERTIEKKNGA